MKTSDVSPADLHHASEVGPKAEQNLNQRRFARPIAANERDDASFRAIYRLARLDADRLTLDFSVEIKALSASAGVQAGDIVWSGAGQLEVDLRRLWPTSASLRLASPQSPHALAVDQGATVETRVLDLRARTP